jgi:hypothetical protein
MRTIIVFGVLLVFSSFCFCQDCKFNNKEIIDEISGFPVLVQKNQKNINRPGSMSVEFYYTTNRCWILLNLRIERGAFAREMNFNSKTPIVIAFNDSSKLQLLPSSEYFSSGLSNVGSATLFYGFSGMIASTQTFHVFYDISKENVELLASKEIQKIRISYLLSNDNGDILDSIRYKENTPSNYGRRHVQSSSRCILSVDFKDPNVCLKQSLKSNGIDTIAKLSKEQLLEKIQSGIIDITLTHYQNFDEIQIGDIVMFSTADSDVVYGIVVEKNEKSLVKIKTHPIPGSEMVVEEDFKNIHKTHLFK